MKEETVGIPGVSLNILDNGFILTVYILGPVQDVTFLYTGSYLSELQSCALILSTNFYFIFAFK